MAHISPGSSDEETLETLLDTYNLSSILEALARIAYEKGDHVLVQYNDEALRKSWQKAAHHLNKLAASAAMVDVSL